LNIDIYAVRHLDIAKSPHILYFYTVLAVSIQETALSAHRFGGAWTERKLSALGHYLVQYQVIFKKNPAARKLRAIYVDAFAGTGDRDVRRDKSTVSLFGYPCHRFVDTFSIRDRR